VRGSVGVGGDVLEEHLRELASGVVRHVSVQAVAVGLGHLLLSAECREQSFRQGTSSIAGSSQVQNKKTEWLPLYTVNQIFSRIQKTDSNI